MHRHNERTFRPEAAHKLEDPERLRWLPPDDVAAALQLRAGMTVADIGAGTGYFSIPFARLAERVLAVDFQPEMLEMLRAKLSAGSNVETTIGEARATGLPDAACDVALIANVWHELDGRDEVLTEMRRIVRPSGALAILDWRADVEPPPGPPLEHRVPLSDVADELRAGGWSVDRTPLVGPYSYIIVAL